MSGSHKDGVGFHREGKDNTKSPNNGHKFPKFIKEKGNAPMINDHSSCAILMLLMLVMLKLLIMLIP